MPRRCWPPSGVAVRRPNGRRASSCATSRRRWPRLASAGTTRTPTTCCSGWWSSGRHTGASARSCRRPSSSSRRSARPATWPSATLRGARAANDPFVPAGRPPAARARGATCWRAPATSRASTTPCCAPRRGMTQWVTASGDPPEYGLGLMHIRLAGRDAWGHSGDIYGLPRRPLAPAVGRSDRRRARQPHPPRRPPAPDRGARANGGRRGLTRSRPAGAPGSGVGHQARTERFSFEAKEPHATRLVQAAPPKRTGAWSTSLMIRTINGSRSPSPVARYWFL